MQVGSLLDMLQQRWRGSDYDPVLRNCLHFANEFACQLGVDSLPDWVTSLSNMGIALEESLRRASEGAGEAAALFIGCHCCDNAPITSTTVDFSDLKLKAAKKTPAPPLPEIPHARSNSKHSNFGISVPSSPALLEAMARPPPQPLRCPGDGGDGGSQTMVRLEMPHGTPTESHWVFSGGSKAGRPRKGLTTVAPARPLTPLFDSAVQKPPHCAGGLGTPGTMLAAARTTSRQSTSPGTVERKPPPVHV